MGIVELLFVVVVVVVLPLFAFLGLISLGIVIWSWKRIGPYFVAFGRWVSDWRNIVPLGCLGFLAIVLTILVAMLLPPELSAARYALLAVVLLVGAIVSFVAAGVWVVRFGSWFWSGYRRSFWNVSGTLYESLWRGMSTGGAGTQGRRRAGDGKTRMGTPVPQSGEKPGASPGPTARRVPASRRSWLFAFIWGRSQQPAPKPRVPVRSSEAETEGAIRSREPALPPRVPAKQKPGLRPLAWRLGLLGRPRGVKGKSQTAATKTTAETSGKPVAPPTPAVSEGQPTRTVAPAKPVDGKAKPAIVTAAKPRRGISARIGGVARSVTASLEAARRRFWAGVFWVLRLLHLGGKRR